MTTTHSSSPAISKQPRPDITLTPMADIAAHDDHYHIHIALPGAHRDAIQVEHHRGILSVSADVALSPEKGRPLLEEFAHQRWQRSFQLSDDCDPQQISAQYEDGILQLRIAKSADKSPQKISIQ